MTQVFLSKTCPGGSIALWGRSKLAESAEFVRMVVEQQQEPEAPGWFESEVVTQAIRSYLDALFLKRPFQVPFEWTKLLVK